MTEEKSLKNQAEEIIIAVDQDLSTKALTTQTEVESKSNSIIRTLFNIINDADIEAVSKRVVELKQKYPALTKKELVAKLIQSKCKRTGTVGAVTSGAGLIPGIGTATAMTLGAAADIGATFKLQAELVLEIAAVYEYPLTEDEKQSIIFFITGISAGASSLARQAGKTATIKIGEKVAEKAAEKAFLKALPIVGVIASAGVNVLSTYIIGQRADAYFRLGPEAVGSWADSLRAVSGIDERKIKVWLTENGKVAGDVVSSGAKSYGRGVGNLFKTIILIDIKILKFIWWVLSAVPKKVISWIQSRKTADKRKSLPAVIIEHKKNE